MNFRKVGALAGVAVLTFAACSTPARRPRRWRAAAAERQPRPGGGDPDLAEAGGDTSKGTVTIAIELPQQGSEKAASEPIINGIKLAVKLAGGTAGGYAIEIPQSAIYDDALNGAHDPQTGASNMTTIAADEATIAVIGPLNSSVAAAQIPISNEAGLLQCSPGQHEPGPDQGSSRRATSAPTRTTTSASSPPTTSRARLPRSTSIDEPRQEVGLHHRRHRDVRQGHRRRLRGRVLKGGGTVVERDGGPEDHDRTTCRS